MKKILTIACACAVLPTLASATPITSPIYLPQVGKILTDLSIGHTSLEFDEIPGDLDYNGSIEKSWNITVNGAYGATDKISVNYGFDFDLSREIYDSDEMSAKFTNFYVGATSRVFDDGLNKVDFLFNVGQKDDVILANADQVYVNLAARYGLDLNAYNVGFTIGGKLYNNFKLPDVKGEREFGFYFKLENEIAFSEQIVTGLDLFYNSNGDITLTSVEDSGDASETISDKIKSFGEYGVNADVNYNLNKDSLVGAYFTAMFSDIEYPLDDGASIFGKDTKEYKFGLKFVSLF